MTDILNNLILVAGELGSIVFVKGDQDHIGCQVKSKTDENVIYDFYVTKKEEKKNA